MEDTLTEKQKYEVLTDKIRIGEMFLDLLKHPAVKFVEKELETFVESWKTKWFQLTDEKLRELKEVKSRPLMFLEVIHRRVNEGRDAKRMRDTLNFVSDVEQKQAEVKGE